MTQALTGHGCFQYYLHRMGRAASACCHHCNSDVDTIKHTHFECQYWNDLREDLGGRLGHPPAVEDMSAMFCGPAFEDLPLDQSVRAEVPL